MLTVCLCLLGTDNRPWTTYMPTWYDLYFWDQFPVLSLQCLSWEKLIVSQKSSVWKPKHCFLYHPYIPQSIFSSPSILTIAAWGFLYTLSIGFDSLFLYNEVPRFSFPLPSLPPDEPRWRLKSQQYCLEKHHVTPPRFVAALSQPQSSKLCAPHDLRFGGPKKL